MSSIPNMAVPRRPRCAVRAPLALMLLGSIGLGACALPDDTDKTKKLLQKYGTIEAEWQVRDEANKKTYTYLLLRNQRGTFETHEIAASDVQRKVLREQAGGIDSNGCFLYEHGKTTPWVTQRGPEILASTSMSGDKMRTACLEYQETAAWQFVPEKDRKAAEPPPPEPAKPAAGPDAGTPGGTPEEVKSAMPQ